MTSIFRTFLSGLIVLLPVAITLVLVVWLGGWVYTFVGPSSVVGRLLAALGFGFTTTPLFAYLIGIAIFAGVVFLLGVIVESRLQRHLKGLIDSVMQRLPLLGSVYDLIKRFVALMDRKDGDGLKSMSPVWCFFGGEGGAGVLALLPSPEPISISGASYFAILVPSAPVPVGGGLIYVPAAWIKPADIGVDALMSVYVSMGVVSPVRTGDNRGVVTPVQPAPQLTGI
ncbi:MAG: DUF502 domain-containing protein [Pseudorhodoplanes sp.]|nr:DUF502 domain-containing protein [Pseudorhodoplanes sp.]